MKYLVCIFGLLLLLASPALAQEDDGGDGGLFSGADWGDSDSGDREGGEQRAERGVAAPSPLDRMRDVLAEAGLPLSEEQQTALQNLLDEQRAAFSRNINPGGQQRGATPGESAREGTPPYRQRSEEGGQMPGDAAVQGVPPPGSMPSAGIGMRQQRGNDFEEKALALLTPQQQEVWKKFQREQIFSRGGYPALRLALEEAGSPPTPEQDGQLQEQFRAYNQQLRELRQTAGPGTLPDAAKLKELENQHLAALVKLLDPAQRKALLEWRRASQNSPKN